MLKQKTASSCFVITMYKIDKVFLKSLNNLTLGTTKDYATSTCPSSSLRSDVLAMAGSSVSWRMKKQNLEMHFNYRYIVNARKQVDHEKLFNTFVKQTLRELDYRYQWHCLKFRFNWRSRLASMWRWTFILRQNS